MADNADLPEARNDADVNAQNDNGIHINARDRLFHAIFIKVACVYIRLVPKWLRSSFEILVLAKALVLFTTLSYIHFTFSKNPMDCLEKIQDDWPRDGILQLQIVKDYKDVNVNYPAYFVTKRNLSLVGNATMTESNSSDVCPTNERKEETLNEHMFLGDAKTVKEGYVMDENYLMKRDTHSIDTKNVKSTSSDFRGYATDFPNMKQLLQYYAYKPVKNQYVMEYALEYGFLRLSYEARQKLRIPVKVVNLDPKKDKCFGDSLSRFILDKFLGYDDILMGSMKRIAEKENNQGYMKNVLTGEHYKFVTSWMGRTSYLLSFLLMFVFTISVSTLLRFCHQQIFIFIVHLLHVMDWNITYAFPVAPLFTVILSLVGMEAIMAEFFNDTTTSFYIILIVWAADQFDSICCHTRLSQKFWPRFFFLYHFVFYAYHYRFNGQCSTMALAASWFFIQHSMLYFLHNYEIPAVEAGLNRQENLAGNYLDDAVDLLVDEINVQTINDLNLQQNNEAQQNDNVQQNMGLEQDNAQLQDAMQQQDAVQQQGVMQQESSSIGHDIEQKQNVAPQRDAVQKQDPVQQQGDPLQKQRDAVQQQEDPEQQQEPVHQNRFNELPSQVNASRIHASDDKKTQGVDIAPYTNDQKPEKHADDGEGGKECRTMAVFDESSHELPGEGRDFAKRETEQLNIVELNFSELDKFETNDQRHQLHKIDDKNEKSEEWEEEGMRNVHIDSKNDMKKSEGRSSVQ